MTTSAPSSTISRSRLEFLFDGVFTIAMTILVLELRVPELETRRSVYELAHALSNELTALGSWLLSFFVLGMLWFRHNRLYHMFSVITPGVLAFHFVQLAAAAFFPFCAGLFGHYPMNPLAGLVYVSCVAIYAWAAFGALLVGRHAGALEPDLDPAMLRKSISRHLRGCALITAMLVYYLAHTISAMHSMPSISLGPGRLV